MDSTMKSAKQKGRAFILYKGESAEVNNRKFLCFLHVSIKNKKKFEEEAKNVNQTNS